MAPERSYNGVPAAEMKIFLDEKFLRFNNSSFIAADPISVPHRFTKRADIEIAGFLAATIAWGRRDLILRSCDRFLALMDNKPHEFVIGADKSDLSRLKGFVHRTFNGEDLVCFIKALKQIYTRFDSMEEIILEGMKGNGSLNLGLIRLRKEFFSVAHEKRSEKHLADVTSGAAAKKLFMFLRWMVRSDNHGVDLGLWKGISPAQLYIPLDVHSGNTARKLGLLTRKQNDWKAVEELTEVLRSFDPDDPVKYDFALFGLGVNNELNKFSSPGLPIMEG
jgi:uncharacterized protein (TIGR02757 family)